MLASATAVHGLVEGWRVDLGVRGAGAALATGVLWHVLRAQRIRAILIAIVAYCAAFLPVASMDEPQTLFAVLLAIPAVVAGAGIFGMSSRAL